MEFEWDENKATSNLSKHGIDFQDAIGVFFDLFRIEQESSSKDYGETRLEVIGMAGNHLLFVVYTKRNDKIRIISARRASRNERREYR